MLDFDYESELNFVFSFGNLGIIFNSASAQLFPPREKWQFGWVRGHPPTMAAEINRCRFNCSKADCVDNTTEPPLVDIHIGSLIQETSTLCSSVFVYPDDKEKLKV